MKKSVRIVLGITIPLLVFTFPFYFSIKKKVEINAFIQPMYTELLSDIQNDDLWNKYCSQPFKETIKQNQENLNLLKNALGNFGRMTKYDGILNYNMDCHQNVCKAIAMVKIEFENKTVVLKTAVLKTDNKWYLHGVMLANINN